MKYFTFVFTVLFSFALAGDIAITVNNHADGTILIESQFLVSADAKTAWTVLSDYNHIADYSSSVQSSTATRLSSSNYLVDQVMMGELLFLKQKVHLKLHVAEEYLDSIHFYDTAKQEFSFYEGEWNILPTGKQTRVEYYISFKSNLFIPPFLQESLVADKIKQHMKEVKLEIENRYSTLR